MRNHGVHNFIICIMMLICVISLEGVGIEDCRQLLMGQMVEHSSIYVSQPQLISCDNVSNIKIVEKGNVQFASVQLRASRSAFSYRSHLSFLCALTFLSGLFWLAYSQRFVLRITQYVKKKGYLITYIENTDGRKRFS